jgi:hypothetical protein
MKGQRWVFLTVRAKMYEPEHNYSADLFLLTILEPPTVGSLQNEQSSLMRHGQFSFETVEEVNLPLNRDVARYNVRV